MKPFPTELKQHGDMILHLPGLQQKEGQTTLQATTNCNLGHSRTKDNKSLVINLKHGMRQTP